MHGLLIHTPQMAAISTAVETWKQASMLSSLMLSVVLSMQLCHTKAAVWGDSAAVVCFCLPAEAAATCVRRVTSSALHKTSWWVCRQQVRERKRGREKSAATEVNHSSSRGWGQDLAVGCMQDSAAATILPCATSHAEHETLVPGCLLLPLCCWEKPQYWANVATFVQSVKSPFSWGPCYGI